jgi:hypothetical protein
VIAKIAVSKRLSSASFEIFAFGGRWPRGSASRAPHASAMDQSPATKNRHRIEIKVTEAQKSLIIRAAAASRQGISEFVREVTERAATEVLNKN